MDGQLIAQFPYAPDHAAKIKTVVGRRWHATEQYWTVPQGGGSLGTLLNLMLISDGTAWAQGRQHHHHAMHARLEQRWPWSEEPGRWPVNRLIQTA